MRYGGRGHVAEFGMLGGVALGGGVVKSAQHEPDAELFAATRRVRRLPRRALALNARRPCPARLRRYVEYRTASVAMSGQAVSERFPGDELGRRGDPGSEELLASGARLERMHVLATRLLASHP